MLALLPALISQLPSLISTAEGLFSSKGDEKTGDLKKEWVVTAIESFLAKLPIEKVLPDYPNIDEKRLVLRTLDVWIEELVPAVVHAK